MTLETLRRARARSLFVARLFRRACACIAFAACMLAGAASAELGMLIGGAETPRDGATLCAVLALGAAACALALLGACAPRRY